MALQHQFVLFGDSITQGSWDMSRGYSMAAELSHAYIRRLDVINRGYSGYNTDMALKIVDEVLPPPKYAKIDYLTVFFGANDACHTGCSSKQDVPLERFKANLRGILMHPAIAAHSPRIVLITTPPVDEYLLADDHRSDGKIDKGRSAQNAKAFADTCKALGDELAAQGANIAVCDLWSAMMSAAGSDGAAPLPGSLEVPQNIKLSELFYDGLHFSAAGYRVLHKALQQTLAERWEDSQPDRLQQHLPEWRAWLQSSAIDRSKEDN